jgi:hypothetical protein
MTPCRGGEYRLGMCGRRPAPLRNPHQRVKEPLRMMVQPINRHSLRNGFNGVLRALPGDRAGDRALLPPSSARSSLAHLTPASGCQDHTPSPSAPAPFVRTSNSRASPKRPSHPDPRFVTTRDPPLLPGQDARIMPLIWDRRQGLFCISEHNPCDRLARRAIRAWRVCGNCPSCKIGVRAAPITSPRSWMMRHRAN